MGISKHCLLPPLPCLRRTQALIAVLITTVACTPTEHSTSVGVSPEPTATITPEPYRTAGTVAYGAAAAWSEVCIAHSSLATPQCTRADYTGNFRFNQLSMGNGLLRARYMDAYGGSYDWLSLFISHPDQAFTANINPTTDILTRIWTEQQFTMDTSSCFSTPSCLTQLEEALTLEQIQRWQQVLSALLAPFWPTQRNLFTDPYLPDPELDALDAMHDAIRYHTTSTELIVTNSINQIIAQIDLAALLDGQIDAVHSANAVSDAQAQVALSLPVFNSFTANYNPITANVVIQPGLIGSAPFALTVNLQFSNTASSGGIAAYQTDITDPQGVTTRYTDPIVTHTLTQGGQHSLVIELTDAQGFRHQEGRTLHIDRSDDTPQTYGSSGTCRPTHLTANSLNLCIATLDGGQQGLCSTYDEIVLYPIDCNRSNQLDGDYLGTCTLIDAEVQINHYDNPLRNTAETFAQQQTRQAAQCSQYHGIWQQ